MKKVNKYETLYRKNNETGRIIIDIALEDYQEFFHEWDNSAFKKRDIHPELAEFLDLCSEDIPLRKKLEIVFCLNTAEIDKEKEEQIRISYLNYYNSTKRLVSRKIKRIVKVSGVLLFISLTLLSAYTLLSGKENTFISNVLLESLLIGGWVFCWEAVHLLFLDIIEPFRRNREINRFLDTKLSFRYLCK
ncbi:MAG: hypothetical protein ACOX1Y_13210 [Zhaonellaceae bacterium]|jgi:hypothetical protein|nr:hypothetical protein [Clostridia bacterium]